MSLTPHDVPFEAFTDGLGEVLNVVRMSCFALALRRRNGRISLDGLCCVQACLVQPSASQHMTLSRRYDVIVVLVRSRCDCAP